MRAVLTSIVVTVLAAVPGVAVEPGAAAAAVPTGGHNAADRPGVGRGPAATTASTACTATDPRLIGLSGLAVTENGYVAIADSNVDKTVIRIFYLDSACKLVRSVGYPTAAYDPEDLAIGRDGTLYVADIGDNASTRSSIAVWRLAPGGTKPQIFRYSYPDGAHDAEALLLAADDTPIFVTKEPPEQGIYVPEKAADPSGTPVALKKVGTFTPTGTGTPNDLGVIGEVLVTGGANSPDRKRVALRTYSDAYEWGVPDGDIVKAITTTKPRITPLPDEAQGESIAYGLDGTQLYTVGDQEVQPVSTPILRYPASAAPAASSASHAPAGAADDSPATAASRMLYVIGGLGVLLVVAGGVGVAVARRRT